MSNIDPVYGNKKTKRYHSKKRKDRCRMSQINEKNLSHFGNPDEAEENGYTACLHCYPEFKPDILR